MNYFLKKNVRKKSLGQFLTCRLSKGVRVEIVCRLLYQFMRWQKINPTLTGRVSEDMRGVPCPALTGVPGSPNPPILGCTADAIEARLL